MSVASEISRIKTGISDIYTWAAERGLTLPDVQNLDNLITLLQESGLISPNNATRYGLTFDNFLGYDNGAGVLSLPSVLTDINMIGVTQIGNSAQAPYGVLQSRFAENQTIRSFSAPDLVQIGYKGLYKAFDTCTNLTSVYLPNLAILDDFALFDSFTDCYNLTTISLPRLSTPGTGLQSAFRNCTGLKSIYFGSPEVASWGGAALIGCFASCSALTAIHFVNSQAVRDAVNNMFGVSNQWGATNATIYYDL